MEPPPDQTKTVILNPIISCLAGGRNKMVAAKAYDFYNGMISGTGLGIRTPETTWDVSKREIPLWVQRLGGHAVIGHQDPLRQRRPGRVHEPACGGARKMNEIAYLAA